MYKSIEEDKVKHIIGGMFVYVFITIGVLFFIDNTEYLKYSIATVYVIAVAKEIYDYFKINHTSDFNDLTATVFLPSLIHLIWLVL